jgi:two-component system, LytTR family, sensor kinase
MPRQARRTALIALSFWAAATLLQALVLAAQEKVEFAFAVAGSGVYYLLLGVLAMPVWRVCASLGERRRPLWQAIAIHVALGLAVLVLWQGVYFGCLYLFMGGLSELRLRETGLWQVLGAATIYAVMVVGIVAVQTSRRLQIEIRRQAELRLLAREAEIRALKLLIRPHFFFNAMNSIYALIETRPHEAQEMVELLADLMRQTLDASDEEFVSLDWELQSVETYLRIEKVRLGDRLTVRIDRHGAAPDLAVPPFLLQPLVENAIKHGIAPTPGPGEVAVAIHAQDGRLRLSVRDSGEGCEEPISGPEGHGLSIVRRRLENLYGCDFSVASRNLDAGGFEISVEIPLQKLESLTHA